MAGVNPVGIGLFPPVDPFVPGGLTQAQLASLAWGAAPGGTFAAGGLTNGFFLPRFTRVTLTDTDIKTIAAGGTSFVLVPAQTNLLIVFMGLWVTHRTVTAGYTNTPSSAASIRFPGGSTGDQSGGLLANTILNAANQVEQKWIPSSGLSTTAVSPGVIGQQLEARFTSGGVVGGGDAANFYRMTTIFMVYDPATGLFV